MAMAHRPPFVSKTKVRWSARWSAIVCQSGQCSLFTAFFCICMTTHLVTTGDGPISIIPKRSPQHSHHRTHCFYCYFLGWAKIITQCDWTQSQTPRLTLFGSTEYAFRCGFRDLLRSRDFVSRDLIGELSQTGYSWKPMAPTSSMDLTRLYTAFLRRWCHQSDRGWWDRADGRPVAP